MKVELVQIIRKKDNKNGMRDIHKFIETEIKPNVGDYITNDSLWKDPYEYRVNYVELDLVENEIRVVLDDLIVEIDEHIQLMEEAAIKYHGWRKGGLSIG